MSSERSPAKVLFLDIDGVLNNNTKCENGHCAIDLKCVRRLNRLLQAIPDLKIVISSDWREWVHSGEMQLSGLEALLLTHAVDCEERVLGVTRPDKGSPFYPPENEADFRFRAVQINEWVREHEPTAFLVLDDHPVPGMGERLLQTDGSIGLVDADIEKAIALLSR